MTSITLIVAAYMAGLGLGSLFGGRLARKIKKHLFAYGLLELGIGMFGLVSLLLLGWIGRSTAGSPYWLVFILSFAFLLAPTFLMGITLPLLSQAFIRRVETSGRIIGLLYGINTLGAAIGCLSAGYVLIGKFGFDGASLFAVILNIVVGLAALISTPWVTLKNIGHQKTLEPKVDKTNWGYYQILFASFMVGFIDLGFEMLWIRILHIVNKNTSYGFPSILFIFLLGLAIGGYYWGRRADKTTNPERLFWNVEIAGGIVASLAFLLIWISLNMELTFPGFNDFWVMQKPVSPFVEVNNIFIFSRRQAIISLFNYFTPIALLVLPASLILGGGLPILDRIAINNPEIAGKKVGDIHLANIIGSVFGSLIISFLMLPNLGTEWTHRVLILLGLIFPVLYFTQSQKRDHLDLRSGAVIGASLILLFLLPSKGIFYKKLFENATNNNAIIHESSDSVLALTIDPTSNKPSWLWINGETNSFYPPDGTYEGRGILCAGASRPERVLIIGMGGGIAARFFQSIADVREIVIVELMTDLGDLLYDNVDITRPIFADPRIQYVTDDGRRYLYANPGKKFDIIFADPLRWYSSGHNNLYSVEAMELYKSHLSPNGVFCAYVDQNHSIPLTMAKTFPEMDQYGSRTIIASNSKIQYDQPYMEIITKNYFESMGEFLKPGTEENLRPKVLLSKFIRDREQILSDEKKAPVLSDLRPALEYYFLNPPIKRPIWPKDDVRENFIARIKGCNLSCAQEILKLASPNK
jgi:predicted membrane-bound spermidine synthase